ncbi:MAG: hypothetical protein FWG14_10395, partial [Peptococcaceae bacterium]|nr:hypothetical protein [Peptococcaceae bacterium]
KIRTNFSEITNYWRHYGFYQGRIPFVTILFAVESTLDEDKIDEIRQCLESIFKPINKPV